MLHPQCTGISNVVQFTFRMKGINMRIWRSLILIFISFESSSFAQLPFAPLDVPRHSCSRHSLIPITAVSWLHLFSSHQRPYRPHFSPWKIHAKILCHAKTVWLCRLMLLKLILCKMHFHFHRSLSLSLRPYSRKVLCVFPHKPPSPSPSASSSLPCFAIACTETELRAFAGSMGRSYLGWKPQVHKKHWSTKVKV